MNNSLTTIHPETFRNLSELHKLSLSGNKLGNNVNSGSLNNLTVHRLAIENNNIEKLERNVFQGTNRLSSLNISHNPLKEWSADIFANLHINSLDISDCNLTDFPTEIFKNTPRMSNLNLARNRHILI